MKDEIAARLREARQAQFRHANEAAESLGVKYPTYAGHENGSRMFEIPDAVLYARRFKVSLDWLLTGHGRGPGGVESPIRGDGAVLAFLKRIEGLTDNDIDLAFGVIKNAIDAKRAAPEPSASRDQPQPASPRRESAPSRRRPQRSDA